MYISLNEIMTRYEYEFLSKGERGVAYKLRIINIINIGTN